MCEVNTDDVLMIPGPQSCPTGYDRMYAGWLAANNNNGNRPNNFVRGWF